MSYYILFNQSNRDPHIAIDSHGFTELFNEYDDAQEEAENSLDDEHYRSYTILRDNDED